MPEYTSELEKVQAKNPSNELLEDAEIYVVDKDIYCRCRMSEDSKYMNTWNKWMNDKRPRRLETDRGAFFYKYRHDPPRNLSSDRVDFPIQLPT